LGQREELKNNPWAVEEDVFSVHPKMVWKVSSSTGALVTAGSLQPIWQLLLCIISDTMLYYHSFQAISATNFLLLDRARGGGRGRYLASSVFTCFVAFSSTVLDTLI